jgi:hypothetical protein
MLIIWTVLKAYITYAARLRTTKFVIAYKNRQYTFGFYSQILLGLENPYVRSPLALGENWE